MPGLTPKPRPNWPLRLGWVLVFGPITALVLFTAVLMCSLGWGGQVLTAGSASIGMGAFLIARAIEQEHKDA